jgi:hypothetical protein
MFDVSSVMNYEQIKALAKQTRRSVNELIVLAPNNDPFYTGTPGDKALGEWFAALWQAFGYDRGVHIRRVHYQVVSQDPPVLMPNGKPYENTVECWDVLNMASKAARYLQLVDPAAFDDRRNPGTLMYARHSGSSPDISLSGRLYQSDFQIPAFPDLPTYSVSGYRADQEYHLEVWCEKSTANDVLIPLCQTYGANLQTGLGELSITATLSLVKRLMDVGKPARILYVSDFDPAGQSMPVAVSRKIEYFVRTFGLDLDIRLFPVVLTLDQVNDYQLPRTPIKESERRRSGFEERFGTGAVELDALEALYPGELRTLLSSYLEAYYDVTLWERVNREERRLEKDLSVLWKQVIAVYQGEIDALKEEHAFLEQEAGPRLTAYGERMQSLWQAIKQDLRLAVPALDDYPVPVPLDAEELGSGLYDSTRDYMGQLDVYKQFQGRA